MSLRPAVGTAGGFHAAKTSAAVALALAIGCVDVFVAGNVRLAVLQFGPIALAAWFGGRIAGHTLAAAAGAVSLAALVYDSAWSSELFLEGVIRAIVFSGFAELLARLRETQRRADLQLLAVLDSLAGLERQRVALERGTRLVALGEFASAVAHQLSQPLAATTTYLGAARQRLRDDAPREAVDEVLEKTEAQAERAAQIVHSLRRLLRQPQPAARPVELPAVIASALRLVQAQAREAGVEIVAAGASGRVAVRGDALLLEQMVLNLLANAIEAVRALPAPRRRVEIETALLDGRATLAVADLGPGIDPARREALFHALREASASGGLGLGLSICRAIAEAHGGAIRYEANRPFGARFVVELPAP